MSAGPGSKGLVLIADDEAAFRMATRAYLRQHGYECEVAPDGTVAAELLRSLPVDVLISDINMPGNRGLEFIESLPQVAAGLPVILLTGHPSAQSVAHSERLQVVAYLVKPPEPEQLLALVNKAVADFRARRGQ
jgi:DNA-binding NtrC family response regulator